VAVPSDLEVRVTHDGPGLTTGRGSAAVGASSRAVASVGAAGAGAAVIRSAVADAEAEADAVGGFRGARSELRRQMRAKRRLRVLALVSLSVLLLGLLPLIFGIRSAMRDPVFRSLDALEVPGWAATHVQDQSSGSRWCFIDCRFRERTAQSQQPFAPTTKAYSQALTVAGWQRWKVSGCPDQPIRPQDGTYTCWRRDEFTLDLWVRLPECAVDALAAQDPAVVPPSGIVPTTPAKTCVGSTISIKVQNAITDTRGKPVDEKPGLTGETPLPVLSNDPLLQPTPLPS
jgi:hypothetical protein